MDIDRSPGDGTYVTSAKAGEWLEYTIAVADARSFDFDFRVASRGVGGTFHLEMDGIDVTGELAVPNTRGQHDWTTLTHKGVMLAAGTHVLRLVMDSNGSAGSVGNFNWLRVRPRDP